MTDPDDDREFTAEEKRDYNPRVCPDCEERTLVYEFKESTAFGQEDRFVRGIPQCTNPACPSRTGER